MKLPQVTISGSTLSDIFFNFDNVNLANAQAAATSKKTGLTIEEYREELMKDAKEFSDIIGGNQVLPDDLVEDFMARI